LRQHNRRTKTVDAIVNNTAQRGDEIFNVTLVQITKNRTPNFFNGDLTRKQVASTFVADDKAFKKI